MIAKFRELLGIKPAPDYKQFLKEGGVVIDVRNKAEYARGHIRGSKNIPLPILNSGTTGFKDKDQPIITCCASGLRSASAKKLLRARGFTNVHYGGSWSSLNSKLT